jgi:hypothetical protein
MRVIILLANILLVLPIQAQNEAASPPRFGLHLMPLSLTNVLPRYRLGGMVMTDRMSYLLDVEYGSDRTGGALSWNTPADRFIGVRPEVRYLLIPSVLEDGVRPYLGLELPVTYYEDTQGNGDYVAASGTRFSFDRATQERLRITAILKGGFTIHIGDHLYIDLYGGTGYGSRRIRYLDEVNRRLATAEPTREWGSSSDLKPAGWHNTIEVALGFRIGYLF